MPRSRCQLRVRDPQIFLLLPLLARPHRHAPILQTKPVDTSTLSAHESELAPRAVSRLIGLYCILVALSMITRKQATLESVTAVLRDPSMMFVLGAITLVAGLAMVLAHNIWSGGALAVIVTLVGWMTL